MVKAEKAEPIKFWRNLSLHGFMGIFDKDLGRIVIALTLAAHAISRQTQHLLT